MPSEWPLRLSSALQSFVAFCFGTDRLCAAQRSLRGVHRRARTGNECRVPTPRPATPRPATPRPRLLPSSRGALTACRLLTPSPDPHSELKSPLPSIAHSCTSGHGLKCVRSNPTRISPLPTPLPLFLLQIKNIEQYLWLKNNISTLQSKSFTLIVFKCSFWSVCKITLNAIWTLFASSVRFRSNI